MNEKKEALRMEILKYIEKHSRVELGELAVLVGVEETDVANEIADMEKEKIICGYHTLIDWDKAGVEMVTALIEVRVTPQRDSGFDRIAERLYNYPEVYAVYLISGSYDLLVTLEGKTLKEVSRFVSERLSTIDGVLSTATYFILKKYKEVVFWYAGSGDDSKLKELMKKYPGRIFHTLERNDLFQTLQHCRFYLNTYPICGGLMYQYAALAGIVPVTLRHDEDADGYLLNQEKLVVDFENKADLYQEVDKLIRDDTYFYERRNQLRCSVVSEEEFMCNLKEIMNNNDIMEINYTDINTDVFRSEYLNRISQYDIDSFLISKKTIKTILKYFPMHVLRGIIKKLISKCK